MKFSKILSYSLRIIDRNRAYSAINLLGLSLGLAVFTLIVVLVRYEFGYDKHNTNYDRIYRVVRDGDGEYQGATKSAMSAEPMATALKESVKEADHITRIARSGNLLVQTNETSFFEEEFFAVDPGFFDIFSLQVIAGETTRLLANPTNLVITESIAIKYYGSAENAIGKIISTDRIKTSDHEVQAVVRDMPFQSHFRPRIMFQFEGYVNATQPSDFNSWNNMNYWVYFTLEEGSDVAEAQRRLNENVRPKLGQDSPSNCILQPLSDVYLGERMSFDLAVVGDKDRLFIFLGIAILVLAIACINYINMATARAINRAKEIGVRKVNGALRVDLIIQFLSEAFLSTLFATIVANVAVFLILPAYNQFMVKEMPLAFMLEPASLLFTSSLVVIVTIIAGTYPAFLFSSFKPVNILKGSFRQSHNSALRNILVVFQFVVSGALIFSTLILWKQTEYVKNKNLGFNREHIVIVNLRDEELGKKHAEIRELLLRNPAITNISASMKPPTGIQSQMGRVWPGKNGEQDIAVYHNQIDTNFLALYQIRLVAGSNLTSTSQKIDAVVNEALVRELGYTNDEIVGKLFARPWDSTRIVGVIGDFHFQNFKLKIEPLDLKIFNWGPPDYLSIKVEESNLQPVLDYIKETLAGISEKYPFEYSFYDELYGKTFAAEAKTSKLMMVFSTVAIIIAALGLYGLILHMVNRRMKEIGVRKTLGAGSLSIVRLLSGRFGLLIVIGYVIACAIGYYGINQWLEGFAYKITPTVTDFLITLSAIAMITGLAVYSRIAVALRVNPAIVLKQDS